MPPSPDSQEVVQLTREELDDLVDAVALRVAKAAPAPEHNEVVFQEAKSLLDDVLGRIDRATVLGVLFIYEAWTGHLNTVIDVLKVFLESSGG